MHARSHMLIVAIVSSLLLTAGASAGLPNPDDFLAVEQVGTHEHSGDTYDVYQLFACFTGDGGLVGYWGSEADLEIGFTITNDLSAQGDALGSGFFSAVGQVLPLPDGSFYDLLGPDADNSTYMTIGVEAGYDQDEIGEVFRVTPGFNPAIDGESSFGGVGGVVTNPGAPNSFAGPDGKILLGRFAVLQGEHVSGVDITVAGQVDGEAFELDGLSFTTIPAPGALALLGLAGLAGTRRRRA